MALTSAPTLRLEQGTAACGRGDDHLGDYLLARDCADRALTKIIVAIVLDTSAPTRATATLLRARGSGKEVV
jgi:hypothetical protein